jgi:hypothetical protein
LSLWPGAPDRAATGEAISRFDREPFFLSSALYGAFVCDLCCCVVLVCCTNFIVVLCSSAVGHGRRGATGAGMAAALSSSANILEEFSVTFMEAMKMVCCRD